MASLLASPTPSGISSMPSSETTEISTDIPTTVSTEMPSEEPSVVSLSIGSSTTVPTIVSTEIESEMPTTEPTSVISLPALSYSNFCSPTLPCKRCVGDCNLDSDCEGELVCKNREGGEPIEGCDGADSSSE